MAKLKPTEIQDSLIIRHIANDLEAGETCDTKEAVIGQWLVENENNHYFNLSFDTNGSNTPPNIKINNELFYDGSTNKTISNYVTNPFEGVDILLDELDGTASNYTSLKSDKNISDDPKKFFLRASALRNYFGGSGSGGGMGGSNQSSLPQEEKEVANTLSSTITSSIQKKDDGSQNYEMVIDSYDIASGDDTVCYELFGEQFDAKEGTVTIPKNLSQHPATDLLKKEFYVYANGIKESDLEGLLVSGSKKQTKDLTENEIEAKKINEGQIDWIKTVTSKFLARQDIKRITSPRYDVKGTKGNLEKTKAVGYPVELNVAASRGYIFEHNFDPLRWINTAFTENSKVDPTTIVSIYPTTPNYTIGRDFPKRNGENFFTYSLRKDPKNSTSNAQLLGEKPVVIDWPLPNNAKQPKNATAEDLFKHFLYNKDSVKKNPLISLNRYITYGNNKNPFTDYEPISRAKVILENLQFNERIDRFYSLNQSFSSDPTQESLIDPSINRFNFTPLHLLKRVAWVEEQLELLIENKVRVRNSGDKFNIKPGYINVFGEGVPANDTRGHLIITNDVPGQMVHRIYYEGSGIKIERQLGIATVVNPDNNSEKMVDYNRVSFGRRIDYKAKSTKKHTYEAGTYIDKDGKVASIKLDNKVKTTKKNEIYRQNFANPAQPIEITADEDVKLQLPDAFSTSSLVPPRSVFKEVNSGTKWTWDPGDPSWLEYAKAGNKEYKYRKTVRSTTETLSTTTSDIRLKTNIAPTEQNGLETINKILVRQFEWLTPKEKGEFQKIGFVADELEKLDPQLVIGGGETEEGSMNLKTIEILPLMAYQVKAIQELSEENDKLKSEIKSLSDRILKLEK